MERSSFEEKDTRRIYSSTLHSNSNVPSKNRNRRHRLELVDSNKDGTIQNTMTPMKSSIVLRKNDSGQLIKLDESQLQIQLSQSGYSSQDSARKANRVKLKMGEETNSFP